MWLHRAGLGNFEETFRENAISGDILPTLTNEVLRNDMKIAAYGHRAKILKAIRNVIGFGDDATMSFIAHRSLTSHSNLPTAETPIAHSIPPPLIDHPQCNHPTPTVIPLPELPEIPKVGRRKFFNTKVGKDIRLNPSFSHVMIQESRGSCVMCFSESTTGRRRELTTTRKCRTCQVHLCAKKFGGNSTSCFDAFHEMDTLEKRPRPAPRPRVTYILPNWDPATDSYESLKRAVQNRQKREQQS
ncbi:Aste57867_2812 [Aphanomyces stellatus]|uniref:Aste57867_2812 protein n=1 Tax=Aphanomyces stellatus TaxID=120398 RepID=A0A485K934_9STRA|nr:hypothetical protein As57867_002805 [Aphanomyces stellatus]VFT80000.1 Aste57867_2812 [Aphanomyces stellatus]